MPSQNSFQRFVKKQLTAIEDLKKDYPFFDFDEEVTHFNRMLLK